MIGFLHTHPLGESHKSRSTLRQAQGERDSCGQLRFLGLCVFVVTDPARAWGTGEYGKVREFGKELNNSTAAAQPILVETPPPADLVVQSVIVPGNANVGDKIDISYTIANDSINTAYGRWTDAIYLSSDNEWDLSDQLLGRVDHVGDLIGNGSYSGSLSVNLPAVKDGQRHSSRRLNKPSHWPTTGQI